ncbi:pitrilysin family protein [Geothrix sp. PMB-07]|uniref:M16 family metallopeptidase n=1 Tax=Geothrix sp. PMB-07 TaxID=3068640 RepID=UPI002741BA28|nr:pitrilysin family protein [Geothrix sp. PMB-07]WLT31214.1 pitrilysin family protein [Geothrix sp. PMB-07]
MPFSRRFTLPLCGALAFVLVAGDAPKPAAPAVKVAAKGKAAKPVAPAILPAPVKGPSVEGITEYRLANGLRVLLFPDPSKPTITTNITYLVGSRHESYGETGMAHLLEHLVFKPSKNFSGKNGQLNIVQALNKVGARFNGTTSLDRTNYFVTFPATDENLKLILDMEADRMVNANIDQNDLWNPAEKKGEMTVVRNEMEGGENNPLEITMERTAASAYEWHNYGKSTIGARTDVEHVNIDHLRAFYRNYYQPDNAVFLVAGKFDEASTLALINERFGRIPKPSRVIEPTYTLDPTQDGERSVMVRRVGDVQILMAAYHIPAGTDAASPALAILGQILADTPAGRLHKALVDTKRAAFVFADIQGNKEPGLALFATQLPKDSNLEEAKAILLKTIEEAAAQPFTQEELDRAKQQILKQVDLNLNQSDRLGVALSEYIAQGDWRLFFLQRDQIKQVTLDQVREAAAKYFKRENRTLGQFIPTEKPDRAEIPAIADAEALVKNYKGQAAVAKGDAFDASPAHIDATTQRFVSAAGMKVALLPKKTRGESVSLQLNLHLGSEASLKGKDIAGSLAAQMLMRGSAKHSRQQIQDELDHLKAELSLGGDAETVRASLTTVRAHLPAVLDLLAELLKQPAYDQDEFAKLVNESSASIEASRKEPGMVAQMALRTHLDPFPQGHVRHVLSIDESIAAIKGAKLEEVKAFHQAFYGASAAELSVVGDFDAAAIQSQVQALFGSWKAPEAFQRIPGKLKTDAAPLNARLETPEKAQAFFLATLSLPVKDSDADYPALVLGNHLLGGGAINSRIANRLRQKEGLSYGAGSQLMASAQDQVGQWLAYAIYAPENLERLEAAFREELTLALDKGFTAEEIAAAKTSWLQAQATGRAQDRPLAGRLSADQFNGRTQAFQADLESKVQALGNDQILAALRKYFAVDKLNIARAGDFAKSAKK